MDSVALLNEKNLKAPSIPVPLASIEDHLIPTRIHEPKIPKRAISLQHVPLGKPCGVVWKPIDDGSGAVENVKPILQGPGPPPTPPPPPIYQMW